MTKQYLSRKQISATKLKNFTLERRQSKTKAFYGTLLVVMAITMAVINPVELVSNWLLDIKEGSILYHIWENPQYEILTEVWIYNYTNEHEFLNGDDKVLKLKEVGPFTFHEIRTNENITIDNERGLMTIRPKILLKFIPDQSLSNLNDTTVRVPNLAVIAFSTLAADKLGYLVNVGAYYSLSALGVKLFKELTVDELFWGYRDPLVSITNGLFPNWIDFGKLGILDRLYAQKPEKAVIELKDANKKFSIKTWNDSPGLKEQGFKDINSSTPCNLIEGSYEGFMVPANFPKGKNIVIFRKQACRVYPFDYQEEISGDFGYSFYRYTMSKSAFSKESPYACKCEWNCLPEGFVDISRCYYGFAIALSKPHFLDVDSVQQSYFEGMHPDPDKYTSHIDIEPITGAVQAFRSSLQVNIAVRMSLGNPITKPLKDKVLPLLWISLTCKQPSSISMTLLQLRLVIGPPMVIIIEVLLFTIGLFLGIYGFYRFWKPKYSCMGTQNLKQRKRRVDVRRKSVERHSVVMNTAENSNFRDDEGLMKQADSLLAFGENDNDVIDLIADE